MFAWGLRHVNVYTVAAGGEGHRQGPKRRLTLTRVDVTKVYYKIYDFERYALWSREKFKQMCFSPFKTIKDYSTLLLMTLGLKSKLARPCAKLKSNIKK